MSHNGKRNVYFPKDLNFAIDHAGSDFPLSRICQEAVRAALEGEACHEQPRLVVKRDGVHLKCNVCHFDEALGSSTTLEHVEEAEDAHRLRRVPQEPSL